MVLKNLRNFLEIISVIIISEIYNIYQNVKYILIFKRKLEILFVVIIYLFFKIQQIYQMIYILSIVIADKY